MKVGDLLVHIGANTRDFKRGIRGAQKETEKLGKSVDDIPDKKSIKVDVNGNFRNGFKDLQRGLISFRTLVSLAPMASSAIIGTTGALGGLVSMLGAATAGVGGFAAVAIANLNDVFEASKDITKAQQDMAKATTYQEQQTAIQNLKKAYMGLNAGQIAALNSLQEFKTFWQGFSKSFQSPVLASFALSLRGLQTTLENMKPTIKAAGNAIVALFKGANDSLRSADMQKFFAWLETSAGPAIYSLGLVFGNTLRGILNLMVAFEPISKSMQGGLVALTQKFAEWSSSVSKSEGFKNFLAYVQAVGPQLMTLIGQLAQLFINLMWALAPAGSLMLSVVNGILKLMNGIMQLNPMLMGAVLSFLVIGRTGTFLAAALTRLGGIFRLLAVVITKLTPLGRIAGLLIAVAMNSEWARQKVQGLWNTIKGFLGFTASGGSDSSGGLDAQLGSIEDITKAYDDYANQVGGVGDELKGATKAADKFLASFDEVHQIPDQNGAGGMGSMPKLPGMPGSGSGGSGGDVKNGTDWIQNLLDKLKEIPAKVKMPDIELPNPPDGGAGAVATAWVTTQNLLTQAMNAIIAKWNEAKIKLDELQPATVGAQLAYSTMLENLTSKTLSDVPILVDKIGNVGSSLNAIPSAKTALSYSAMLEAMTSKTKSEQPAITPGIDLISSALNAIPSVNTNLSYSQMLEAMTSKTKSTQPEISAGVDLVKNSLTDVKNETEPVKTGWHNMLDYMQSQINAYQPYISYGILLITISLSSMGDTVKSTLSTWANGWDGIFNSVKLKTAPIISLIESIKSAYASLMATMGQTVPSGSTSYGGYYGAPNTATVPNSATNPAGYYGSPATVGEQAKGILSDFQKNVDAFNNSAANILTLGLQNKLLEYIGQGGKVTDQNGAAGTAGQVVGSIVGVGGAAAAGASKGKSIWEALKGMFEKIGTGNAVPGFATGGVINSDRIVRVGEGNKREAIVPLDSGAMDPFADAVADRMNGTGGNQSSNGDIYLQVDGTTFARIIGPYTSKEISRIGGSMIVAT